MSAASKIRHSFIGTSVRQGIHIWFRLQHRNNKPVAYRLPLGVEIQLYPEGEIAEFMAFPMLFEQTELSLVASYLKPGMKVVDVGANIGLYSLLAEKRTAPGGNVWAFEPSRESFRRLNRNLGLNNAKCVDAIQMALSDTPDAVFELTSDKGFGDAYRYLRHKSPGNGHVEASGETVPVTTLDAWSASKDIHGLDLLKVDIEGGEYRMFCGAQETIKSSRDIVVVFESQPDWCARAGCKQEDNFRLLEQLGLGLYTWDKQSKEWKSGDSALLNSDMIWACFDSKKLPRV